MTIHLPPDLEEKIRRVAGREGCGAESLVERAVRDYLDADAITDVTPAQIAETQMKLATELRELPTWPNEQECLGDEAG